MQWEEADLVPHKIKPPLEELIVVGRVFLGNNLNSSQSVADFLVSQLHKVHLAPIKVSHRLVDSLSRALLEHSSHNRISYSARQTLALKTRSLVEVSRSSSRHNSVSSQIHHLLVGLTQEDQGSLASRAQVVSTNQALALNHSSKIL